MELTFTQTPNHTIKSFVLGSVSWYERNPGAHFLYPSSWSGKYMLQWDQGKETGNDM